MRYGIHKKSARVPIETSNLPAPLVGVDVGGMITVVTTKTVLLASCVVVWDKMLGVVDEAVNFVELVVVEI